MMVSRCSCRQGTIASRLPAPWQEFVDPVDRVATDPLDHIGEPGLRLNTIELAGFDQRVEQRRGMPALDRGRRTSSCGAPSQSSKKATSSPAGTLKSHAILPTMATVGQPLGSFSRAAGH